MLKTMALKPQDIYVVLKILAADSRRASYAQLAVDLVMSPSEVHASVKRAETSHLLHGPELQNRPNVAALEEFLVHGMKYVFPAEHGQLTRGVPTSYGAAPLSRMIGIPPPSIIQVRQCRRINQRAAVGDGDHPSPLRACQLFDTIQVGKVFSQVFSGVIVMRDAPPPGQLHELDSS